MKQWVIVGAIVLAVALTLGVAMRFSLSALPEPGHTETFLATQIKRFLVHKGSRQGVPPAPADRVAGAKAGEEIFSMECASCHGSSGYDLTDAGRWMYPRAADLTSRASQSYSDQEIFWIVKNGVRMTGMPAFGKVESEENIWDLVFYVRILPKAVPKAAVAQR
jgi:mono/diheme cytochrome c family protein